jgi:hypothetical protein
MALPDYLKAEQGTSIIWGESGGSGVTNTLSLDALANGSGRMSASVDLGSVFEDEYVLEVRVETGTAPTAGTTVEVYLAYSTDNSNWPGKVTGSDAAYPTTVANNKLQLGLPASILVATNDSNTTLKQNGVIVRPAGRYVVAVVVNLLGQAFRDEATASNNDSRVILTPLRPQPGWS